jgi:fibronectin-binding autotransporter adhesin
MLPGRLVTKKIDLFLFFLFVLISSDVVAQFHNTAFWKRRGSSLKFSTASQSLYAHNCSGVVTVATFGSNNTQTNVTTNTTISLTSSGTVTFYSDSMCTKAITNLTIYTGSSSENFYFIDTAAESPTITATATSYLFASQSASVTANPFIWTGGGGNSLWTTAANWSGGVAPGSSNSALFNGSCGSNCSPVINSSINVGGVRIKSDYTGAITQSSGVTVTVNSGNWVQLAGTFTGSDADISVNGSFALAGGTFTSTSGTLAINGLSFQLNSGSVFNHNSGRINATILNAWNTWTMDSAPTFNILFITNGCGGGIKMNGSFTTVGLLTFDSGCRIGIDGGFINAKSNVLSSREGAWGTTVLNINGSTNQTISSAGGTPYLPDLVIASTGGTVTLSGNIFLGMYTYSSGTLDTGTSTLNFNDTSRTLVFIPGDSNTYYNIKWSGGCNSGFTLSGILNVTNQLELGGGCDANVNGGTINLLGNLVIGNQGGSGSVKIIMNGSGNQNITGGANSSFGVPYLEIANTGGTVTLQNLIKFQAGFKYTSGVIDATSSDILIYDGAVMNTINSGSMEFNTVTWSGSCNGHLAISGSMIIKGTMKMEGPCGGTVNGGKMLLHGDVVMSNGGGNVQLEFTGTTNSNISGTGPTPSGNIVVSKTGGASLIFQDNTSFNAGAQAFVVSSGIVNMNGKNLTLQSLDLNGNNLTKNAGVLTVNGSIAGTGPLYNGTVNP